MSDYTLAVNWSGKDSLSDSDSAKVISGSDFNTEFTTIRTAVNSKANLNGSASESFSATTAVASTNTTQVATTAYVTTAIAAITSSYPIGSIFTTTVAYANSAAVVTAIGGTTWTAFGAGKVLVGVDSSDSDFNTVEETGGSKTHTLTTNEMPAHSHDMNQVRYHDTNGGGSSGSLQGDWDNTSGTEFRTTNTGGGAAHTIVQPYITVYMWKRTA